MKSNSAKITRVLIFGVLIQLLCIAGIAIWIALFGDELPPVPGNGEVVRGRGIGRLGVVFTRVLPHWWEHARTPFILVIIILAIQWGLPEEWRKPVGGGSVGKYAISKHFSAPLTILLIPCFIFWLFAWLIGLFTWHLLWGVPLVLSVGAGLILICGLCNERWKNWKREKTKSLTPSESKKFNDFYNADMIVSVVIILFLIVFFIYWSIS